MRLTQLTINSFLKKQQDNPKATKLFDGESLYLYVRPYTKSASWRIDYRFEGKYKTYTIGLYPTIGLKAAREAQHEMQKLLSDGIDPMAEKKRIKEQNKMATENTFYKAAIEWHKKQSISWSEKHSIKVLRQIEKDLFPTLGYLPLDEITPPVVTSTIKTIEARGVHDHANRCLQRVNRILDYAVQLGNIPFNPCHSLSGLVTLPPTQHQLALAQDELTIFFKRLEEQPADLLSKLGLIFLIITFVRSTSLRTMEWEDVNFKKKEWLIPKEKFKGKKIDLVVPLSDWAIEILDTLYENSRLKQGYIFHQQRNVYKPMSENTLTALMWRMGYKDIATPHGFRSLATDVLNENNYKSDVIERQMGHVEKNSVRRAYHRAEYLEERKEMMQWYSDWIRKKYRKSGQSIGTAP